MISIQYMVVRYANPRIPLKRFVGSVVLCTMRGRLEKVWRRCLPKADLRVQCRGKLQNLNPKLSSLCSLSVVEALFATYPPCSRGQTSKLKLKKAFSSLSSMPSFASVVAPCAGRRMKES